MPQKGPGPIPANSIIFIPFNGPIYKYYWKSFDLTNKLGSKVNDDTNEIIKAMLVNKPNKTVGKKFEKLKIEKPIDTVAAV
jgi:hypothetical protein